MARKLIPDPPTEKVRSLALALSPPWCPERSISPPPFQT